jgi:hypothetical protein
LKASVRSIDGENKTNSLGDKYYRYFFTDYDAFTTWSKFKAGPSGSRSIWLMTHYFNLPRLILASRHRHPPSGVSKGDLTSIRVTNNQMTIGQNYNKFKTHYACFAATSKCQEWHIEFIIKNAYSPSNALSDFWPVGGLLQHRSKLSSRLNSISILCNF